MNERKQTAEVIVEEDDTESETSGSEKSEDANESSQSEMECDDGEIDEESKYLNEKWADSIAKILKHNKPKKKKSVVLSKAKKLTDKVKKVKTESFEVATNEGQVKKEMVVENETNIRRVKKIKKELPNYRVKPDILQKDTERMLQKIATMGVVRLFNSLKTQQKDIDSKLKQAGSSEIRKEKVLKNLDTRSFLDTLMSEPSVKISDINKDET